MWLAPFYRMLGFFGLLIPWNRMVCRLGRYYQYQPGVCGWCGRPHVVPRKRRP